MKPSVLSYKRYNAKREMPFSIVSYPLEGGKVNSVVEEKEGIGDALGRCTL